MLLRRHRKNRMKDAEEIPFTEVENLSDLTVKELKEKAKELEIEGYSGMNKAELIEVLGRD